LVKEEIFGPVLCVLKPFKTLKEALERANDSDYGLAGGMFSKDSAACEYFVRNMNAGTLWVNNYNCTNYNIPFGGFKQSGFGRDNGAEAISEYTTTKSVYVKHNLDKF
jgi:acyl-CoA reductase-like NAD-dependent aldehyde dehydrogenase